MRMIPSRSTSPAPVVAVAQHERAVLRSGLLHLPVRQAEVRRLVGRLGVEATLRAGISRARQLPDRRTIHSGPSRADRTIARFPSTDPSLLSRQAGMGIVLGFRLATFR